MERGLAETLPCSSALESQTQHWYLSRHNATGKTEQKDARAQGTWD